VKIPAVALKSMTLLPGIIAHFDVSREKSLHAIEQAMMADETIFLVTQKDENEETPTFDSLYKVGVIVDIKQIIKMPDNIVRVLVEAQKRARLVAVDQIEEYILAQVEEIPKDTKNGVEVLEAMNRGLKETFTKYFALNPKVGKEFVKR